MAQGSRLEVQSLKELLVVLHQPGSEWAERFEYLRHCVLHRHVGPAGSVLVASAWPGEGKSFVAANLAAAIGSIGKRVILIDGDLRRPTVSQVFGLHGAPGLSNFLNHEMRFEDVLHATEVEGVSLVPAGSVFDHGQLEGTRLQAFFTHARERADILVVDAPPLSLCADAIHLGRHTGGVYFVTSDRTFQGVPEGLYSEDLRDEGIHIYGAILNRTRPRIKQLLSRGWWTV
ncbi:MAG: tyrosine-protein kinase family protein [Vulcanimicrobiota bacterium]